MFDGCLFQVMEHLLTSPAAEGSSRHVCLSALSIAIGERVKDRVPVTPDQVLGMLQYALVLRDGRPVREREITPQERATALSKFADHEIIPAARSLLETLISEPLTSTPLTSEALHSLKPGQSAMIGRASSADLTLSGDSVSRMHVLLIRHESGWTVMDAGSRNGTLVEGKRATAHQPITLASGATIEIGAHSIPLP